MDSLAEEQRPAMSSTPLEPLAMIPGGMWDQVGWWDQIVRNRSERYAIALRLREVRRSLGISQAAISLHLGLTDAVVAQWENGHRPIPAHHIRKIEDFLGRSLYGKAA